MKIFDRTLEAIDNGRLGLNEGLFHGFPRLTEYIPNIQKKTYYTVAGETASGKTALTDYMFMYSPFDYIKSFNGDTDLKLKIIYWSFEIDIESKITKGICQKIYKDYGILTDVNYILSKGKNRISDEVYQLVLNTRGYFDELHDVVEIYAEAMNPTGISKRVEEYMQSVSNKHGEGYQTYYTPKDSNLYVLNIIDHCGLIKAQADAPTKKERIDAISSKLISYRNKYGMIPVMISQFNRGIASVERELASKNKPDYSKVRPQLADIKDTGSLAEDSNVVLSIFSPNRYSIPDYNGYDITKLRDRHRSVSVLKGRDGVPDLDLGVCYLGECGLFKELPIPNEITQAHYSSIINKKKVTTV